MKWLLFLAVLDTDVCVWVCVLNLISLPLLLSATLITYSAVCHLIVAIVMLIRAPHAEKGNKTGWIALFSIWLSTRRTLSLPPSLPHSQPSSYRPFISPVPHFIHPSFYVFSNRCNNRLIWKTLNYHASALSAHINAAETEEQIKLTEIGRLLFGETAIIRKCREKKAAPLFPAREFKMSPVSNMCTDWRGWGSRTGK